MGILILITNLSLFGMILLLRKDIKDLQTMKNKKKPPVPVC